MPLLDDYLTLRRASGFKLNAAESRLRRFVSFALARGDTYVRAETAIAWAGTACSPAERHARVQDVAVFARHLRAEDVSHEMPDVAAFRRQRLVRLPHIYTDVEIARILDAASALRPVGSSRPDTYRTLFALLAAAGLRIGEGRRLKMRDVVADALFIHETKFGKSRWLPLHATTASALEAYRSRWRVVAEPDDPFFVSTKGTPLARNSVFETFDEIVRALGLRKPGTDHRRPSPCLHDLRHTFAVRSLEACPTDPSAIDRHMLALSTYMGHTTIASTFWYLHTTPSLMRGVADACEASFLGGSR